MDEGGQILYFPGNWRGADDRPDSHEIACQNSAAAARRRSTLTRAAPAFSLYGETPASHDDDFVHIEEIAARSQRYDWEIGRHVHHGLCQILMLAAGEVAYRLDEDGGDERRPVRAGRPAGDRARLPLHPRRGRLTC